MQVFALLYFVYVALSTLINKEEKITSNTAGDDHGYNNTLSNSNTSLTGSILLPTMITSGFHSEKNYLPNHNFEERSPRQRSNSTNVNWNRCNDNLNSEGLWRNLSRHHWPELLYLYGVNVIDRYVIVD